MRTVLDYAICERCGCAKRKLNRDDLNLVVIIINSMGWNHDILNRYSHIYLGAEARLDIYIRRG